MLKKYLTCGILSLLTFTGQSFAAQQVINDGETVLVWRSKINSMTGELYNQYATKWASGVAYTASNQFVTHGGNVFVCTTNHTSGATTEPGVGASWAANWKYAGAAAATAEMSTHEAAGDPHPTYTTAAEAGAAAPIQSITMGENMTNSGTSTNLILDSTGGSGTVINLDTTPTEGSTTNAVSSDGVATALGLKADNSGVAFVIGDPDDVMIQLPVSAATAMTDSTKYAIATVGDTDFTLVGAASNTVGEIFTATGAGAGSGTVYEITALLNASLNYGDADDDLRLWPIDRIGTELALKQGLDTELTTAAGADTAGNDKYFGTNSGGTPGFYDLPTGGSSILTTVTYSDETCTQYQLYYATTPGAVVVCTASGNLDYVDGTNWDAIAPTPPSAPNMAIAGAGPQTATFTYLETITADTPADLCDDWSINMSTAGPLTMGYVSGDTTTSVVCSVTEDVYSNDTVATASYTPGTIKAVDDSTLLASIADYSTYITNNSAETSPAASCSATPFYIEDTVDFTNIDHSHGANEILVGGQWLNGVSTVPVCRAEIYIGAIEGDVSTYTYQFEIWKGGDGATTLGTLSQTSQSFSGATMVAGTFVGADFTTPVDLDFNDSIVLARTDHTTSLTNYVVLSIDYNGFNDLGRVNSAADGTTSVSFATHNINIKLYGEQ